MANTLLGEGGGVLEETAEYRALQQPAGPGLVWWLRRANSKADQVKASLLEPGLAAQLAARLRDTTGPDTACLQLALCKLEPVLAALQSASSRALAGLVDNRAQSPAQHWLLDLLNSAPNSVSLNTHGTQCEQQYPACPLFPFQGGENSLNEERK